MAQLQADCRRHVVEAGQGFPTRLCYSKEEYGGTLYWDLSHLHDSFRQCGFQDSSSRFFKDIDIAAAEADLSHLLHLRGNTPRSLRNFFHYHFS